MTTIHIPNSVQTFNDGVFRECHKLTDVTFDIENSQIRSIGKNCFWHTYELKKLNLPKNSLTVMEDQIFAMMKIDSFNIPDSVTTIKNRVFYSTFTLTSITIPRNVTQINSEAFVGSSITDVIVNIDKLGTSNFPTNTDDDQTFVGKTGVNYHWI